MRDEQLRPQEAPTFLFSSTTESMVGGAKMHPVYILDRFCHLERQKCPKFYCKNFCKCHKCIPSTIIIQKKKCPSSSSLTTPPGRKPDEKIQSLKEL
jgi:hypothetical protein